MKNYIITTLVLGLVVVVGAFFLVGQRGDAHFKNYEYTPEDWVTTNNTQFSTDLSNGQYREKYNYKWQPLQIGLQLKPIVRYRSNYVVVELPDGRRGIVAPSTLSGMINNKARNQEDANSPATFVKFMSVKEYNAKNKKTAYDIKSDDYGLPYLVFKQGDKYNTVQANDIWPRFTHGIPEYYYDYNDNFKVYVSAEKLATMNKEEVDHKYGDPVSVSLLKDGGKRVFYSHLRTKQGYNYEGVFINYYADGTTVVEDPRDNEDEYSINYIKNESRPFLSRITTIDWVDLPFAFPLISMVHLNFVDISDYPTEDEDSFPYLWVFFGTLVLSVVFLFMLTYLTMAVCFPIKFLSNTIIAFITFIITVIPIMSIGTLYLELFQGLWIIVAFVTLFMVFVPLGLVSSETEFNRCDYCRNVGCVSHTKTLIDTQISTRVDTFDYDDTDTEYNWSGDKKTKTVIHKRDHELIETTEKKFRYDFHCSNCNKDWKSIKTESKDRTLGKKTTSHGGTKTTYKKVRVD